MNAKLSPHVFWHCHENENGLTHTIQTIPNKPICEFHVGSACQIGGPNSVNPGQIPLVCGTSELHYETHTNIRRNLHTDNNFTSSLRIIM